MATRCIWPPERRVTRWSSLSEMRKSEATSLTFWRIVGSGVRLAGERSGKARLSKTVRCG